MFECKDCNGPLQTYTFRSIQSPSRNFMQNRRPRIALRNLVNAQVQFEFQITHHATCVSLTFHFYKNRLMIFLESLFTDVTECHEFKLNRIQMIIMKRKVHSNKISRVNFNIKLTISIYNVWNTIILYRMRTFPRT